MAGGGRWQRAALLVVTAAGGAMAAGTPTAAAQASGEGLSPVPAAAAVVVAAEGVPHVRGLRVGRLDAAALVDAARETCPTVRRLMETLQRTDIMVLVEVRDQVLNRTGHLRFIGAGHGLRWLRITIDGGNRRPEQVGWLAHELQHAVEVAAAPAVTGVDALARLYVRIGTDLGSGQYETDAAIAAGKQALNEAYAPTKRLP